MFDALRTFDETEVTAIYAQCPDEAGLGLAVSNRLKKAAGFHTVDASPLVIGFTGPTGAGKTSALRALEQLGGLVLDCDAIYHELLRTDGALREAITGAFGRCLRRTAVWTGRSWGTSYSAIRRRWRR